MQTIKQQTFCGREFIDKEISLIQEVVATCGGISRHELACTVCELLEVDRQRFYGGCYRASNWEELGETTGRGRMDRANKRHGAQVKTILVYPLVKNAAYQLREGAI